MTRELAVARREGRMPWLHPSSHAIVAVDYRKNIDNALIPTRVHAVSIDTEHDHVASDLEIRSQILENIVKKVIPDHLIDDQTIFYINQKGHSGASGPQRHPGITGRKIIVDTYGGWGGHGGGAFSGKVSLIKVRFNIGLLQSRP
jgi:S-adenosylmethionine synthetase